MILGRRRCRENSRFNSPGSGYFYNTAGSHGESPFAGLPPNLKQTGVFIDGNARSGVRDQEPIRRKAGRRVIIGYKIN
jgi:hypothetical protein